MHLDSLPIKERIETVAFVWPNARETPRVLRVSGYRAEKVANREVFETVQESIGWHVTDDQWRLVSGEVVANSMVAIYQAELPVAIACGLSRPSGWTELAWVAVSPKQRRLGLGKMVCGAVVASLLEGAKSKIYGSTQDERLSAIKIYLDIGFHPLYREEKVERWKLICQKLRIPFSPLSWGWPADT
jgi:GNAT superfamily N-acetyltransferase